MKGFSRKLGCELLSKFVLSLPEGKWCLSGSFMQHIYTGTDVPDLDSSFTLTVFVEDTATSYAVLECIYSVSEVRSAMGHEVELIRIGDATVSESDCVYTLKDSRYGSVRVIVHVRPGVMDGAQLVTTAKPDYFVGRFPMLRKIELYTHILEDFFLSPTAISGYFASQLSNDSSDAWEIALKSVAKGCSPAVFSDQHAFDTLNQRMKDWLAFEEMGDEYDRVMSILCEYYCIGLAYTGGTKGLRYLNELLEVFIKDS